MGIKKYKIRFKDWIVVFTPKILMVWEMSKRSYFHLGMAEYYFQIATQNSSAKIFDYYNFKGACHLKASAKIVKLIEKYIQ